MSDLLKCPFCGGDAELDIEVCEYPEGKAIVFCQECGVSTSVYLTSGAIAAWNRREPLTEPEPLSLDQLKRMDGEPVYIRLGDGDQFWALVSIINDGELALIAEYYDHECPDEDFYAMFYGDPAGYFGLHILGWIAYEREPQKGITSDGK